MPYKDKNSPEAIASRLRAQAKYREKNLYKLRENGRNRYPMEKEKRSENYKKWVKTPEGKKLRKIADWKHHGLIETEDYTYEELYESYLHHTNCEVCDVKLTIGDRSATMKCMDHDHETGIFRNILCNVCNIKRR